MKSMYPSIAIIGSKGYLGSRLLQNLNQFFDKVEGIDQHNLAQLQDCLKRQEMIIWAAGLSNHELGKQDPWLDMQLNAIDVIRAASHVTTNQTFIHISSTCVYGNSEGIVDEESQVMPLEPQAYSKFYAEEMLTHIATLFNESTRSGDLLIRWGGEEFVLLFEVQRAEDCTKFLERLRYTVENTPLVVDSKPLNATISLGAVDKLSAQIIKQEWDQWFFLADQALYDAKQAGRKGGGEVVAEEGYISEMEG